MGNRGAVVSIAVDNQSAPEFDESGNRRLVEAILFAATEPVSVEQLADRLPAGADVEAILDGLRAHYAGRGVNLVRVAGKWAFRTAGDLSFLLSRESVSQRRLSRAALETLAIIAYHQPATRADIEEIRGVATSRGTLDVLMEAGWVRMRGRRRSPGRPVTYGITDDFLSHFGLDSVTDLPGLEELKAAGLLDSSVPADFHMPEPTADQALAEDEDPVDGQPDDDDGG